MDGVESDPEDLMGRVASEPGTELGRRLAQLRAEMIASGLPLLDDHELEREIADRRGTLIVRRGAALYADDARFSAGEKEEASEKAPVEDDIEFEPTTELGRRLWELRKQADASGVPLLDDHELEREIADRRGTPIVVKDDPHLC